MYCGLQHYGRCVTDEWHSAGEWDQGAGFDGDSDQPPHGDFNYHNDRPPFGPFNPAQQEETHHPPWQGQPGSDVHLDKHAPGPEMEHFGQAEPEMEHFEPSGPDVVQSGAQKPPERVNTPTGLPSLLDIKVQPPQPSGNWKRGPEQMNNDFYGGEPFYGDEPPPHQFGPPPEKMPLYRGENPPPPPMGPGRGAPPFRGGPSRGMPRGRGMRGVRGW